MAQSDLSMKNGIWKLKLIIKAETACSRTFKGTDFFFVDLLLKETNWLLRLSYILMLQMEHNRLHAIRVTIISDAPEEKR